MEGGWSEGGVREEGEAEEGHFYGRVREQEEHLRYLYIRVTEGRVKGEHQVNITSFHCQCSKLW